MKKINIVACAEAFENLSTFESVEQLNQAVREYKYQFKETLSNTELALLDILHRYSAKYKGVSFLCKNKIAELIGKSRRTVIRVCQRLEALGIIRQVPMKRASDMQQTSNAIVIQRIVTQEVVQNVTPVKQNPSLKQNPYVHNTYPATPYVKFKQFVSNFVDDQKLTSRLYAIYMAQTHYLHLSEQYDSANLFENGLQALKLTFQATKRKRLRNIAGYFNGTLRKLLDRLYEDVLLAIS